MLVATTLDLLERALGPPVAVRTVRFDGEFGAIGRWRHSGAEIDLRGTETSQLLFNISGGQEVSLRGAEGGPLAVKAGSIALVDPQVATAARVSGEADTLQILIPRALVQRAREACSGLPMPALEHRRQVQSLAARSLISLSEGALDDRCSTEVVREAALLAARQPAAPVVYKGGLRPRALQRVMDMVEDHLRHGRLASLDEMADAAGLGRRHFFEAFRASEGRTPHAWLVGRRIDHAVRRLLEDGVSVGDLADETGFASPSHLVSVFRRTLGVTPGRLRQAALGA